MPSSPSRLRPHRPLLAVAIGSLVMLALAGCRSTSKPTPPGPVVPDNSMPVISVPTMTFSSGGAPSSQTIQITLGAADTVALVAFEADYLDARLDTVSQGSASIAPIAWFSTKGTLGGKALLDRDTTSSLTHALVVQSASAQPSGTVPSGAEYARVTLGYLSGSTAVKADPRENAIWEVTIELP